MHKIQILNNIAKEGLDRFPVDNYSLSDEMTDPIAIILRSYNMHDFLIPESVKAIARAGAGVNNIPLESMTNRGIPVFNAPGANANAVKELTIAALLISARNICTARDFVRSIDCDGDELKRLIESGKKKYAGIELPGRTLGVIGLGAIGVHVANAALALGMKVIGYDPKVTVNNAWKLSSGVEKVEKLEDIFRRSDAVTIHVPLIPETKNLINNECLSLLKNDSILINFSRGGVISSEEVLAALDDGILRSYVCDFPEPSLIEHEKVIALPHLGASTIEAEQNCAIMVAENLKDYLENGNISYSVNFPSTVLPRTNAYRLTVTNRNIPNMVGQISTCLASADLNIEDLLNKSIGNLAYTIVDLDTVIPDSIIKHIYNIDGVLAVRNIGID
ncbi:3-phosphoglycerate dehydrogenase family protein [Woeseiaceae bacterium]|jgi:D-3-phosphoglycerate dehydrogenase / 2-oxoglutarate reductase|nr:3-phosphoglycerate dehydrogenase family protein [Woeseiaceae bacterium]|tara:strand:- start:66 stop:1238 length:1173 start_codon:yes stop_codon:yes gene_type:complete